MIIVMQLKADDAQVNAVVEQIRAAGLKEHISRGAELVIIGAIGDEDRINTARFEILPGVERVSRVSKQYKMVSRDTHPAGSSFKVRGVPIGGEQIQVFAGSRWIESVPQLNDIAIAAQAEHCRLIWTGLEPASQSPYEFHNIELDKLTDLSAAAGSHALPFAVELNDISSLDTLLANDVDVIILGAQSMQNRALLRELGRINKPIMLRRGLAASLSEWLLAAEAIAAGGNHHLILCQQSSKTGLDISTIPWLKRETHLPIFVDPSYAGAKAWMVAAQAQAAIAAGADGLVLDLYPGSIKTAYGADQALDFAQLRQLMATLAAIALAVGRRI